MAMLFIDYTNQLLKDFEEKKSANQLSPLLVNPTTAQIKMECLQIYEERKKRGLKEENVLRAFFGVPKSGNDFSELIDQTSADKFRPLLNLLKGRIQNPTSKNVELLAWLIDFTLRPYSRAKEISLNVEESTGIETNPSEHKETFHPIKEDVKEKVNHEEAEPQLPSLTDSKNNDNIKLKWAAAIILIIVTLFGGIYFSTKQERLYGNVYTSECMTWVYDHYEKVPCSTRRERNRIIVPFDNEMMQTFKRITNKDTISASSIGYIYYIKMNGNLEFYTRSGYHPIEVNRSLKVLSNHIYKTYLEGKKSSTKGLSLK